MVSDQVTALTVEATEFPDLARRFGVQGVPRTVVNRKGAFEGALPEPRFVTATLELAGIEIENGSQADDHHDADGDGNSTPLNQS